MKKFSILALTLVLTATMLTACRSDNGKNTSAPTVTTQTIPRVTTAPTTAPTTTTTVPRNTTGMTDPQDTTIGPDGTVGTDGTDSGTEESNDGTDSTGDMAGRARGAMRNAVRPFRQF